MNANRILKRKTKKQRTKKAKLYLRKKLEHYRKENKHLLNPPSIRDFAQNRTELRKNVEVYQKYKELLTRYNKDLLDYTDYKISLYKKNNWRKRIF